jgi:hypothetical protein
MLSFNWLIDPLVYSLPPVQAMLFAGMVSRADNLGRLPGDPTVLLSYLFSPRPPRADVGPEDVSALLSELSASDPAIITWYMVEGTAYVEFSHWDKHQPGLKVHNKKSAFPGPDKASQILRPQSQRTPHLGLDMFKPEPQWAGDVAERLKRGASLASKVARDIDREYDSELVELTVARLEPDESKRGEWYKLAQWLWKDGVTYMPNVIDLLEANARFKPDLPYAYFAKGGKGREGISLRANAGRSEGEHEATKKQEAAWAAGRKA